MTRSAISLRDALRAGEPVADRDLDAVFPEELRDRSPIHWTPVAVARRVAALLAPTPGARVLDVGAGVGKLCLVGAAVTDATWWGIEQDPVQVAAARSAAWALDLERRTRFVVGDGSRLSLEGYDAVYFYNPFTTLLPGAHGNPFSRYAAIQGTLRRVEAQLAAARAGLRVVTYHGFGGKLPAGYHRAAREPVGGDALELWCRA